MDINKHSASSVLLTPGYKVSAGQGWSYFPLKSTYYSLSSWGNSIPNNVHCLKYHQEQYPQVQRNGKQSASCCLQGHDQENEAEERRGEKRLGWVEGEREGELSLPRNHHVCQGDGDTTKDPQKGQ